MWKKILNSLSGRTSKTEFYQADDNGAPTFGVSGQDERVNHAMQQARDMVDIFISSMLNPIESMRSFSVKVPMTENGEVEHMWLNKFRIEGDAIEGEINNEPAVISNVFVGQKVKVNKSEISDWLFTVDGKMHGNFTLRAILPDMPKEVQNQVREKLAW